MKRMVPVLLFLLAACGAKEERTTAYIKERRLDKKGKLVLVYTFHTAEKTFTDSIQIENRIIPNDSLPVFFTSKNPLKNRLELPR